jgi:hypothetical protein
MAKTNITETETTPAPIAVRFMVDRKRKTALEIAGGFAAPGSTVNVMSDIADYHEKRGEGQAVGTLPTPAVPAPQS